VTVALPSDDVPLPLGLQAWRRIVEPAPDQSGSLLADLLGNRRASLLYYGLMSLDGPTRAYFGASPTLLGKLMDGSRPAILASLGRSIRVRGGQIDVPGGPAAAASWEALLSRRVGEPESFILELLDRDGGRAALLYDLVDHLDAARQAFVLGLRAGDRGVLPDRLRALLAACSPSLTSWDPETRPFRRVLFDPVHLLAVTSVLPAGDLPSPAGRRFWNAVFSGADVPDEPERMLNAGDPDGSVDAVWLVERVCVDNAFRRQQLFKVWLFGQRAFSGMAPAALPQALVALRGFTRFPMLLLTLERMGISDPDTCARAVRHAQRLGTIADREAAGTALRQFQGALAILERLRFSRALSTEVAFRLVRSLTSLPISESGEYLGGLGAWLDTQVLPALVPVSEHDALKAGTFVSAEATLLAGMAGVSAGAALPEVEWEGLRYRVDVASAEFARLSKVRQKQGGYGLDPVLELCRGVRRLGTTRAPAADVPALAAALASSVTGLLDQLASPAEGASADLRDLLGEAARDLRKVRTPRDSANFTRVYHPLQRASDLLLAGVLSAIAYTPHLGDPDGPELLAGDPAVRHSFGFEERIPEIRVFIPWRMPQRTLGAAGGWHATGSMLGLDVGFAAIGLRRLAVDSLPPPPAGNEIDRAAVASAVALSSPSAMSDAERDTLTDAIRRGRARLSGLSAHPTALPGLIRAARVNDWWREVIPWAQEHEPDRVPEYFSLADLERIGEAETVPSAPPDAWGAAWLDTQGCVCLRYPAPGLRETLAGRMGTALVTEQFTDLPLRVAEVLADLGLPAVLARSVMAMAAQDVLDAYRPAYIDDWTALGAAVRHVPDVRFVDYIAALTSGGPLVPEDQERPADVKR
jgi:hypothetical protein